MEENQIESEMYLIIINAIKDYNDIHNKDIQIYSHNVLWHICEDLTEWYEIRKDENK